MYSEHEGILQPTLMFRMNLGPQDHLLPDLLQEMPNQNLLSRMSKQNYLPGHPLDLNQPSTKTCSSNAIHSSKTTERGRLPNRQYTQVSRRNLSMPSEMTSKGLMRCSDHSLAIATVESHDSETAMALQ